jgi:hypothetical protein
VYREPECSFQEGLASALLQSEPRSLGEEDELAFLEIEDPGTMRDEVEGDDDDMGESQLGLEEDEEGVETTDLEDVGDIEGQETDIDAFENPIFDDAPSSSEDEGPVGRYPKRYRTKPSRFGFDVYVDTTMSLLDDNPTSYKEAMKRPDSRQWEQAINEEFASLKAMGVFEESDLPQGKTPLPSKLVLTIKRDGHGNVVKYKARLVAKGFKQLAGRDFDEVFAPTAQNATLRVLLAIAAKENLQLRQLDVKTAFLYGGLSEELYLKLQIELGGKVWRLRRALYGLKQAAREWHTKLRATLVAEGFKSSDHDPCLFMKGSGKGRVLLLVHVDDCLIVGKDEVTKRCTKILAKHFELKDLGEAKLFLGQAIECDEKWIRVSQAQYVENVLQRFNMGECKSVSTPVGER